MLITVVTKQPMFNTCMQELHEKNLLAKSARLSAEPPFRELSQDPHAQAHTRQHGEYCLQTRSRHAPHGNSQSEEAISIIYHHVDPVSRNFEGFNLHLCNF